MFFIELRRLIALGSLELALPKIVNAVQGASSELEPAILRTALLLSARFHRLQLERLSNIRSPEELARDLNGLTLDLLNFIAVVEGRWGELPAPAVGPDVPTSAVDEAASGSLRDPREAAMTGNPLKRLAWLHQGLRVACAVCKIRSPEKVGTGFLVRGGRIVTNNHILPSEQIAARTVAIFNFEEDLMGRPTNAQSVELAPDIFFRTSADLDCTIVAGGPSAELEEKWGFLDLRCDSELGATSSVSIIQHPEGGFKQIALAGNIISKRDLTSLYYVTTTMPGSSGAPVFDDDWKVIALHQGGGVWSKTQERFLNNKGIRFSAIAANSSFADALLTDP
jgi:V8-like Glu-specific endopeptidase